MRGDAFLQALLMLPRKGVKDFCVLSRSSTALECTVDEKDP